MNQDDIQYHVIIERPSWDRRQLTAMT